MAKNLDVYVLVPKKIKMNKLKEGDLFFMYRADGAKDKEVKNNLEGRLYLNTTPVQYNEEADVGETSGVEITKANFKKELLPLILLKAKQLTPAQQKAKQLKAKLPAFKKIFQKHGMPYVCGKLEIDVSEFDKLRKMALRA